MSDEKKDLFSFFKNNHEGPEKPESKKGKPTIEQMKAEAEKVMVLHKTITTYEPEILLSALEILILSNCWLFDDVQDLIKRVYHAQHNGKAALLEMAKEASRRGPNPGQVQ